MKLQELLNKHKDKLFHKDVSEIEYINGIIFGYELDGKRLMPHTKFSLSDLLFSTPFLSLLERKINYKEGMINISHEDGKGVHSTREEYTISSLDYHKINLVLLNTDKERIIYLETHTLG